LSKSAKNACEKSVNKFILIGDNFATTKNKKIKIKLIYC
jgi:hypothetical protein